MKASKPDRVTADVQVETDRESARVLEGLDDPIATGFTMEHDRDGTVTASLELMARGVSMSKKSYTGRDTEADRREELKGDPPVYDSDVNWHTGRVDTSEWDVSRETAQSVYERLIDEVTGAVKAGEPEVVVVGEPQYRALWVYVDEVHTEAENPEELVPLRMVVVPGPQLFVETRNLDVLYSDEA